MTPRAFLMTCSLLPLSIVGFACDSGGSPADDAAVECAPAQKLSGDTPLPDDVDAVLEKHCRECHSDPPRVYAPMPLVSWEDAHTFAPGHDSGPAIYELIERRIHDDHHPMPPITRDPLPASAKDTLDAWIFDCAPAASGAH